MATYRDADGGKYKTFQSQRQGDVTDGSTNRLRPVTRWVTVEPAIILYNIAFSASTPLQIQYVNYRLSQDIGLNVTNATYNTSDRCEFNKNELEQQAAVQAAGATYLTLMTLSSVVPCLLTTLVIGAYSDKVGRKYGLIPPLSGEILRIFLSVIITAFRLPLPMFCLALFAQGILGGVGSFLMTCYSYMADVTSPTNRGFRIFIVELCQGLGQIVSQVALGEAIAVLGYTYPFIIILGLQILNMIYIIFILPETLYRLPNSTLLTFDNYKQSFRLYFGASMRGKRLRLGLGLGVMGLCAAVNMVNNETVTLYLVNRPLCWDSKLVGYYTAAAVGVKYLSSLVILRILAGRLPEAVIALISLVSGAGYDVVLGLATQTWVVFMAPLAGFSAQIADPMIRSITSKLVSVDHQGALFASHAWVSILAAMLGTVLFNAIYGASVTFTGLVFIIAAVLFVLPFSLTLLLYVQQKKPRGEEVKQFFAPDRNPQTGAYEDEASYDHTAES